MQYMTIKLPVDVGEKLRELARENCRSMSSQLSYLIKKCTEEEESFEEYYQHNKKYIDKSFQEYHNGDYVEFDSWNEAKKFLRNYEN